MGLTDKNNEEKKEEEEKEKEPSLEDLDLQLDIPPIKQDALSAGIELNIPEPSFYGQQEFATQDSPRQMEVSPVEELAHEPFPTEPARPKPKPKPRDKVLVKADELMSQAQKLLKEHKYEAAIQQLTERINLLKNTKYKWDYTKSLFYGGQTLNLIVKHDEAKLLLEQGIDVLKGIEQEKGTMMANFKLELSIAYRKLAKYDQALDLLTEAGKLYKSSGSLKGYINTLYNKGIIFYDLQDWERAVQVYLEISNVYGDDPEKMNVRLEGLQKIAALLQMAGKLDEAELEENPYLKEIHRLKDDYERALAHELRKHAKGRTLEDIKAEEARDPKNLALWYFNKAAADLTAAGGDIHTAITNYEKAIELYKELGDKFGLSRCYHHLAYIKEKQGKLQEAVELLKQCIELREDIKESMSLEEYRTAIQAETVPIYDDLSYLEAELENYEASLNAIEQSKSRELINYLANEDLDTCPYVKNLLQEEEKTLKKLRNLERELYDFGMRYSEIARRGEQTPAMNQDREKLEKIISNLHTKLQDFRRNIWMKCIDTGNVKPPIQYNILSKVLEIFKKEKHWAILEFTWNTRRAKILVYFITPKYKKLFKKSLTAKELKKLLDQYKTALIEEDEKKLKKSSQNFSDKIIPPEIYAELEASPAIQYLFIIPHKQLHSIPFEIIQHQRQFWGQKYCIVKNFSLDLSRITLQKRTEFLEKHPKLKASAIVVGNPTFDLPNAEIEAREVEKMLKQKKFKVKLMLKKKSKENDFVKEALDKMIIHYAGHGIFITPEPVLSHLLFTSSDLTAREITQLKLKNLPIVILSACETAISGFLGGNELVGFVRSFILAGSTTIITTNWPVSDVSARELIEKFYEFLLMGISVGIALQKARQFIAKRYQNEIIHWAAYTLFGDPFRKLNSS